MAEFEEIRKAEQPWELISGIMQDQFRISQSYYIPMEYREAGDKLATYYPPGADRMLAGPPVAAPSARAPVRLRAGVGLVRRRGLVDHDHGASRRGHLDQRQHG